MPAQDDVSQTVNRINKQPKYDADNSFDTDDVGVEDDVFFVLFRTISLKSYLTLVHTMNCLWTMTSNKNSALTITQPHSININSYGKMVRGDKTISGRCLLT